VEQFFAKGSEGKLNFCIGISSLKKKFDIFIVLDSYNPPNGLKGKFSSKKLVNNLMAPSIY